MRFKQVMLRLCIQHVVISPLGLLDLSVVSYTFKQVANIIEKLLLQLSTADAHNLVFI